MTDQPFVCRVGACPPYEDVVQLLLSEPYAQVLDEYSSILDEDPDYLSFHGVSSALTVQFLLKLNDVPGLCIGECIIGSSGECCIIPALKEAVRRRAS